MLHTAALNIHNGVKVDWKALNKRLRDHKLKTSSSYANQMLMDKVLFNFEYVNLEKKVSNIDDAKKEKFYDLKEFKSFLESIDLFKTNPESLIDALISSIKEEFIYREALADLLNDYKNHSLYADFYKEEFLKPSEVIDKYRSIRRIMIALFQKKFNEFLNIQNEGFRLFKYEDVGIYDVVAHLKEKLSEK